MKVDPKIVLHGGDNTDWLFGSLDDAGFEDVWQQLYDAGSSCFDISSPATFV